jgi:hypothetical protein
MRSFLMRYIVAVLVVLGCVGPVLAAHDVGTPPGQAAAVGVDRNRDGNTNGKDYAPGQSAAEAAAVDNNGNGRTNGQDYAPGQLPARQGE